MTESAAQPRDTMDYIAFHAGVRPTKTATIDLESGKALTYAAFHARVERAVAFLEATIGDPRGAFVCTVARNRADLLVLQVACARTGAVYTPLNWRLAEPEITFMIGDCLPRLLVHDADFDRLVVNAEAKSPGIRILRVTPERDPFDEALSSLPEPPKRRAPRAIDADKPSIMLYTSGTTGRPKGVLFTERNAFFSTVNFSLAARVDADSVFLCEPPLFHTAGLMAIARSTLFQGGTLLISKQFDPVETFRLLADPTVGVTNYFCVPQMARMMRNAPGFDGPKLAKLRSIISGGAPHAAADVARWIDDGVRMLDGFGMSEAGSVTNMPIHDLEVLRKKAGSCGLPLLVTELKIVDESGAEVPAGEVGELWLRTPGLSPGYWKRDDATRESRTPDGWFRTGDAGRFDDDGFLYLVDRLKDMYISGGENVYPAEVEAAIAEMGGIVDVAVIGEPDETWGERGVAYVVPAAGNVLTAEVVTEHCRARLARFKVPAVVMIVEALPRNAAGKLQKHVLRAERKKEREGGVS